MDAYSYHGIIYRSSWNSTRGEYVITIPARPFSWKEFSHSIYAYGLIKGIGLGLVAVSVAALSLTLYPIVFSEVGYRTTQALGAVSSLGVDQEELRLKREEEEKLATVNFASQVGVSDTNFSVYIPKIGAKASVVSNVDPSEKNAYTVALTQGVAHAAGTSLPGQSGASYLFAHSTNGPWNVARYNAVFYLLRELEPGEDVAYVFYNQKLYKYRVSEKHIVDANDVSWITEASTGPSRLILQTCWPPGTVWKRLVILAYPEEPKGEGTQTVYGGV